MALYKPTELLEFLESIGQSPKKGLSQNFLIDGNIIKKSLQAAEIKPGDIVLEIGPGPGALTEAVLKEGASVIAIEKDRSLAEALKRFEKDFPGKLEVFSQDVMTFDFEKVLGSFCQNGKKIKVLANLPYHITTPILTTIIPLNDLFESITVMVQDEVARRFTAKPGNKIYGSITLFLDFWSEPKYAFKVPHSCFFPAPKVESAVVSFKLQKPHLSEDETKAFFNIIRVAFDHRRKMLRGSLTAIYSKENLLEALKSAKIEETARPEQLSLEQFLALYIALKSLSN